MRKVISLFLALCLIAGLLSGCIFKRISAEEDIISMQAAGYLYTSGVRAETSDERVFLGKRAKAVREMISTMEKAAKFSFDLTDGIEKLEDNLLKYIEKIDEPNDSDLNNIRGVIEKITAYKVILKSYEEEIRQYMKMKPDSDAVKAIINTYMLSTVCNLMDTQNEYISFLTNKTSVISILLEKSSEKQADKLISTSISIYNRKVDNNYRLTVFEYEKAALMHSFILSADYYASGFYLVEIEKNIELIKSGENALSVTSEQLSKLEEMHGHIKSANRKPSALKPVPEEESSFSFIRTVSAGSGEQIPLKDAADTLVMVSDIQKSKYDKTSGTGGFEISLLDAGENNRSEANQSSDSNDGTYKTPRSEESSLLGSISENACNALDFIKTTLVETGVGFIINSSQTEIKEGNPDLNSRYAAIIKTLTEFIVKSETIKTTNQIESIRNLIQNELESLLGGDKEAFVSFILNTEADRMLQIFDAWKSEFEDGAEHIYTKDDLISLLNAMGIAVEISVAPLKTPSPVVVTPSPSITPTITPVISDSPSEPETPEIFDMVHIVASYDLIRRLSVEESNERIMLQVYGWVDSVDYSNYQKVETKDKDGNITRIKYLDENDHSVGWETSVYGDSIEYDYHFPGNSDLELEIIRYGMLGNSRFYQVSTRDESIDRRTAVRINDPNDTNKTHIAYIIQKENNLQDGLNTSLYNSNQTCTTYSMGKELEAYTYYEDILIREIQKQYNGDNVFSDIKLYYNSGILKKDYHQANGKDDGLSVSYFDTGNMNQRINYKEGKIHGTHERFYDNEKLNEFITYVNGIKNGITEKYYDNDSHQMAFEGSYADNERSGKWTVYTKDGKLDSEMNYKNGEYDGEFKSYATGDLNYNSIHAFGQYSDGKMTGEWIYGYHNEGWVEKVYYEDGVKKWDEYSTGNVRTYYNPDGSVSHTETID